MLVSLIALTVGNALNKLLHTVGAGLFHLLRDVAVNIERKRSSCMPEIFLHGFDVISALDRNNSIGMAQIMKSGFRCPDPLYDALEAVIYGAVGKIIANGIGEDEIALFPQASRLHAHGILA